MPLTPTAARLITGLLLLVISAIGLGLRVSRLGDVPGNPFYDAAVHTMADSWHAFIFGALDPSGGVSVDKPPVDLWAQVAAVKLIGFTPTALKLPQALAGAASVPLLFDLVRRPFGRPAALAAAAALAVLPVAVLTARSDTMDTLMSFLVLVAGWLVVRAIEHNGRGWLLAAGVALGLAFNVKLFQALLPLPALGLLWMIGSDLPLVRRMLAGLAALLVAVAVGLAWIVPVALTPRAERPYPIGSTNGSIWNLVFVFNGLDRLHGRPLTTPDTLPAGSSPSAAIVTAQRLRSQHVSSSPGAGRLLEKRFAARIGSELLPASLVLLASALLGMRALRRRQAYPRRPLAVATALAVWMLAGVALFSLVSGFHPRYFEAISPAVAGVLGAGLCGLVLRGGRLARTLAGFVVAATGVYVHSRADVIGGAATYELAACAAVALTLGLIAAAPRSGAVLAGTAAAAAVAAVLIVPASASLSVVHTRAFDAERSGAMPDGWPPLINRYLRAHRGSTRFSFASVAPGKAAPLIAADPQPVLMLTSYRSRPLVSVRRLARLVRGREVRYFLIGRRCTSALTRATAACPATARWAIAHGTDVTPSIGLGHRRLLYRVDLCGRVSRSPALRARGRGRSATPSARRRSSPSASRASRARCVPVQRAGDG